MIDDNEEWRPIIGFEKQYEITASGRVRRIKKDKPSKNGALLKMFCDGRGYPKYDLWKNNKGHGRGLHILLAEAFISPKPFPKAEVCHNDGNPKNFLLDNLRWDTHKGNHKDRWKHGTMRIGDKVHSNRLTLAQVKDIKKFRNETKMSYAKIALLYAVSTSTIASIFTGKSWQWIA